MAGSGSRTFTCPTIARSLRTVNCLRWLGLVLSLLMGLPLGCRSGLAEAEALHVPAPPAGQRPPGVYVTWLGTAGVVIDDGETRIVIDPFVTRDRLGHVLFGRPIESDAAQVDRWLSRAGGLEADAVIVTHSHYDHALDAPMVARRSGATLIGSPDTVLQARAHRLPSQQITPAVVGERRTFGRFTVELRPSKHGDPDLFPGTTRADFRVPAKARDYRTGEVYTVLVSHPWGTVLHHGSATRTPQTYDETTRADVVLLGIASREDTASYLREVVDAVGATRVIPMHYDNFFRSLDRRMRPLVGVHLAEFFETAAETRPDLTVQTLPIGEPRLVLPARQSRG